MIKKLTKLKRVELATISSSPDDIRTHLSTVELRCKHLGVLPASCLLDTLLRDTVLSKFETTWQKGAQGNYNKIILTL